MPYEPSAARDEFVRSPPQMRNCDFAIGRANFYGFPVNPAAVAIRAGHNWCFCYLEEDLPDCSTIRHARWTGAYGQLIGEIDRFHSPSAQ
jgi:hypothetical protein